MKGDLCMSQFGDYKNPVILDGFEWVSGDWRNFKIRNRITGDELIWFPMGDVRPEAIMHEGVFHDEHGIAFHGEKFGSFYYNEEIEPNLLKALRQTGGVYLPCYYPSKGKGGLPQFVPGEDVWADISWQEAMTACKEYTRNMKCKNYVKTTMINSLVYDYLCLWLLQQKKRTWHELVENSSTWGNYLPVGAKTGFPIKTGSVEAYMTGGLDWLAGNYQLWTSEKYHNYCRVVRSGSYEDDGESLGSLGAPATARMAMAPEVTAPTVSFMMQMEVTY